MKKLEYAYYMEEEQDDFMDPGNPVKDARKDIKSFKEKVSKLFPEDGDSFYKDTAMNIIRVIII